MSEQNAIQPYEAPQAQIVSMKEIETQAEALQASGLFNDTKDKAQAVVKVMAGHEMGLQPFQAMKGLNIIQSQVTMGADLIAAKIKQSGRYDYDIIEHTAEVCKIVVHQLRDGQWQKAPLPVEYSIQDAKTAGISGGQNWKKHPKDMLFARCITRVGRRHCADIFGGAIFTESELTESDIKERPARGKTRDVDDLDFENAPATTTTVEVVDDSAPFNMCHGQWKKYSDPAITGDATLGDMKPSELFEVRKQAAEIKLSPETAEALKSTCYDQLIYTLKQKGTTLDDILASHEMTEERLWSGSLLALHNFVMTISSK